MRIDLLIRNGRVADRTCDVGIERGRIVAIEGEPAEAERVIDASGCIVLPGLIDMHTHLDYAATDLGCRPEYMLSTGVTTAADAGSTGCRTFESFYHTVVKPSPVKIKAFLHCCPTGMHGGGTAPHEDNDPALFEPEAIAKLRGAYPDVIVGLKLRVSRHLAASVDILTESLRLSDRVSLPLCVHVTDPCCDMEQLVDLLRAGDIVAHPFHGTGNTILDEQGKVKRAVRAARERGVLFDVANGSKNCSHAVSQAAIADGFLPDVISTDMTRDKLHISSRAKNLPFVMSKYHCFGMAWSDVVSCVTETPARVLGLAGEAGTLAPGAVADVVVMRGVSRDVVYEDTEGRRIAGRAALEPEWVVLDGDIAFGQA